MIWKCPEIDSKSIKGQTDSKFNEPKLGMYVLLTMSYFYATQLVSILFC